MSSQLEVDIIQIKLQDIIQPLINPPPAAPVGNFDFQDGTNFDLQDGTNLDFN